MIEVNREYEISTKEAAEMIGVSDELIRQWIDIGAVPARKAHGNNLAGFIYAIPVFCVEKIMKFKRAQIRCSMCGKMFIPSCRNNKKMCSELCREKSERERERKRAKGRRRDKSPEQLARYRAQQKAWYERNKLRLKNKKIMERRENEASHGNL